MKIPKNETERLHGELRGLLATHQISYKEASEIVGELYGTFRQYLRTNGYNKEKVSEFIEEIETEIEATAKAS